MRFIVHVCAFPVSGILFFLVSVCICINIFEREEFRITFYFSILSPLCDHSLYENGG